MDLFFSNWGKPVYPATSKTDRTLQICELGMHRSHFFFSQNSVYLLIQSTVPMLFFSKI